MTAKIYPFPARRMIRPQPGPIAVDLDGQTLVFESPKRAWRWVDRVSDAARKEERRARKEAEDNGAPPLWVRYASERWAYDASVKIAERHGVDNLADVWGKPTPRTHAACVELWVRLGCCATTIAEHLEISVHAVRRDLRRAKGGKR